jgi:hypothetical protein
MHIIMCYIYRYCTKFNDKYQLLCAQLFIMHNKFVFFDSCSGPREDLKTREP